MADMKIRNGFVSNSSSSSFLITFDEFVDIFNIDEEFDNNEYYVIGDELCEGADYFRIDSRDMLYALFNCNTTGMQVIKNPKIVDCQINAIKITEDMVGKNLIHIDADYYPSRTIEDVEDRYRINVTRRL